MHGLCRMFLFTFGVITALPVSLAFNIDLTSPAIYNGEQSDFFGYKVLQYTFGTNKGIIVTAPLRGHGAVCKPDQFQTSQCFTEKEAFHNKATLPVKHLGLSIAKDPVRFQFTVCSPSVVHECNNNSYLNSVCYTVTEQLEEVSSITPNFQECTKMQVDLVFLFDGSYSMSEDEFNKNKDFIVNITKSLNGTSIKFAAVQFSSVPRTVFNFIDYQAGTAFDKLKKEVHMSDLTNTHKALKFVLEELFENQKSGSSSDATKVLVLITDGDPSDIDSYDIIKKYDEKNLIRFVIGVKDISLDKLSAIASHPKDKNTFQIQDYHGLTGILENFQNRIFKMEGTRLARAGEFKNEMSQSGFSQAFYKDAWILGSVGSNTWRGSLQERRGTNSSEIVLQHMQIDSYMGYSTSVGEKNNVTLYFTGAPRSEHRGLVALFRHDGLNWTEIQIIEGEQIGSYFGAELCSVDVNSDGNTDFLLVGAPQFYQPNEKGEGQIYVYMLTDELKLKSEFKVKAPSMGRFGTTIASVADLNGDGLRDVAVGAPLEDDNGGAVYIFLGNRSKGIHSTFSQRISGQTIQNGMRFFGQAIDGDIDLGDDGLPDIAVGSQGRAVVLRSRPVFNVTAHLSFQPKEISIEKIDCLGNPDKTLSMGTLKACFKMVETTKRREGTMRPGLKILCMLDVDPTRQTSRGFFNSTNKNTRNYTAVYELQQEEKCFNYTIHMAKCVKDTLSPISIKLDFTQDDSQSSSAVLNVDSRKQAVIEVPFENQCRKNDICIAELEVDFNFTTPTLLVAEDRYFDLLMQLSNHGDDSYNTSLSMHYPPGLSFSRMNLTKYTRPTLHMCHDLQGVVDKTICSISLPVYRSRSSATFKASFHILTEHEWNDTISMTITGESDNSESNRTHSLTKIIPVQYQIKMAVTVSKDTITYLNFTSGEDKARRIAITFKIDNLGWKAFPVDVFLFFPTRLEHNFEMNNYQVDVKQNKSQCTNVTVMKSEYCSPEESWKLIVCNGFTLDKESTTEIKLSGDGHFKNFKQRAANIGFLQRYSGEAAEVKFKSFMHVSFDTKRYVLDSYTHQAEVRFEYIIPPDQLFIISTGVGLGLLLLIIITVIMFKLGCFKRKKLYIEQEEGTALQEGDLSEPKPVPTKESISQSENDSKSYPSEELNDDGDANGKNL